MTMEDESKGMASRGWPSSATSKDEVPSAPSGPQGDFDGTLKVSQRLPTAAELSKVADLPLLTVQNESVPFKSLYAAEQEGRRVMVIFMRHFFCGNCQEYLRTLCSSITPDSLLALPTPTEIVVIGCGQPELIPFYAETTACKFPIYADPTRKLYDELGMTHAMGMGHKPPAYVQKSLFSVIVQSFYQVVSSGRRALSGGHFWQIGGEFLFEHGDVTWCHRMRHTRDHAEVPEIRRQLRLDSEEQAPRRKRWSSGLGAAGLARKLSLSSSSRERSASRTRNSLALSAREGSSKEGSVMEKVKEEAEVRQK
ncbi:hypothetical protein MMC26_005756 [Xylographa opegraphella]|nr:hypothetical protein [Xylographa opegraphella]